MTMSVQFFAMILLGLGWTILFSEEAWYHNENNGHVYFYSNNEKKWKRASEDCAQKQASLVTVNNPVENAFLSFLAAQNQRNDAHWIGLYCIKDNNKQCQKTDMKWDSEESTGYEGEWGDEFPSDNTALVYIKFETNKWKISNSLNTEKKYICEKPDGCQDNPCQNEGSCTPDNQGGFTCNCSAGFTGNKCRINIDDCASEPCIHGTCNDGTDSYSCNCNTGYTGVDCETDIDECLDGSHDCIHGQCINAMGAFTCNCFSGYVGDRCQREKNECESKPCQNGGSCLDIFDGYRCNCTKFYTGINCEQDINECDTIDFCNNGTCNNKIGGFSCVCSNGFDGARCNQDINECHNRNPICKHDGTCNNIPGSYECACALGYTGQNCTDDIDECSSSPCLNDGACHDELNGYACICTEEFTGIHCETDVDECQDKNHQYCGDGNCTNTIGNFTCDCPFGYTGPHCIADINECLMDADPCNSNGNCTNFEGGFECVCKDGYNAEDYCKSNVSERVQPNGNAKVEDLVPLKSALIVGCVLFSISLALLIFLIIDDRRYQRRMFARKRLRELSDVDIVQSGTSDAIAETQID